MRLEDLQTQPGHLIRRAQQIAVAIFVEECAAFDLTPVQYAAMVAIQENEGIDATRLSAQIAFDRSTLGNVLERLEARGLVERYSSPDDKRVKLLKLTHARPDGDSARGSGGAPHPGSYPRTTRSSGSACSARSAGANRDGQ